MKNEMFDEMKAQMKPDPNLVAKLEAAIELEVSGAGSGDGDFAVSQTDIEERDISFVELDNQPQAAYQALPDKQLGEKQHNPGNDKNRKSKIPIALYISAVAAFALVFVGVGFALINNGLMQESQNKSPVNSNQQLESDIASLGITSAEVIESYEDYSQIYEKVLEADVARMGGSLALAEAQSTNNESVSPAPSGDFSDSSSAAKASASASGNADYSGTNIQVEGIDEGDIVKTDGKYIYAIRGKELVIFSASGSDTKELSRIKLIKEPEGDEDAAANKEESAIPEANMRSDTAPVYNGYTRALELYVFDDVVFAIVDSMFAAAYLESKDSVADESETTLVCVDVADRTSPKITKTLAQSGQYKNSRLAGGVLYLLSAYYVYDPDKEIPETYIPRVSDGAKTELLKVKDIATMSILESAAYTVITSVDAESLSRIDQKSVFGSADTIYMSATNLFIGSSMDEMNEVNVYQDGVYNVTEYKRSQKTQLARISTEKGVLKVAAQGTVEGSLLNQFSLDEYQGNLRLVVTNSGYSYKEYHDKERDIIANKYDDNSDQETNALYVLDSGLNIIGRVEGMAKDERIYSARFAGDVGYMVTFKQIDPLFALDLSNPKNPKIASELKIPGFSTYLHPYGDGKLLGLGFEATENSTDGLKLSMFDISDPFDVSEQMWAAVNADYSPAAYNHKAVLVDVEKNLIGFTVLSYGDKNKYDDNTYLLYEYIEGQGFKLKDALEYGSSDSDTYYSVEDVRGFYAGTYLYIYSYDCLDVFDMQTLEKVKNIAVSGEESERGKVMPYLID